MPGPRQRQQMPGDKIHRVTTPAEIVTAVPTFTVPALTVDAVAIPVLLMLITLVISLLLLTTEVPLTFKAIFVPPKY